ncbi:MAG: hypothetical protein PHH54_03570 [Candidatus Nanoarchaeia archaeon]|nr:hypothetical protein [Candidatus Nanoarchaeia archaeon]MDD5741037.1 hypothetical protein [Candidatus Nanoarchaeia archaeon]
MKTKRQKFYPKKQFFMGNLYTLDKRVYDCAQGQGYLDFRKRYDKSKPWGVMEESPFNAIPLMLQASMYLSQEKRRRLISDYFLGFPNGKPFGDYINRVLEIKWLHPLKKFSKQDLEKNAIRLMKEFGNIEERVTIFKNINKLMDEFYQDKGNKTIDHKYNEFFNEFRCGGSFYDKEGLGFAISKGSIIGPGLERCKEEPDMIMWTTENPPQEFYPLLIKWKAREYAWKGALYTSSPLTKKDIEYLKLSLNNPYDSLLDFCELGLLPYGISKDKGLLIWHPSVDK